MLAILKVTSVSLQVAHRNRFFPTLHSTFLLPRERAQCHPRSSYLEIALRPVPPYEQQEIGGRRVELS